MALRGGLRAGLDALTKSFALQQFGDNVQGFFVISDVENRENVGMIQRGSGTGLLLEAAETFRIAGEGCGQDFDGYVARQPGIAGAVDFAHAAGTERAYNFIGPEFDTGRQRHFFLSSAVQFCTSVSCWELPSPRQISENSDRRMGAYPRLR